MLPGNSDFGVFRRIAARLPIYFADTIDNPQWLAMFVLARFVPVRRAYGKLRTASAAPPIVGDTLFSTVSPAEILDGLKVDGIAPGLAIPRDLVRQIHDFAANTPCFGNLDRGLPFFAAAHAAVEARTGRPILTGHYLEGLETCPAITLVQQDPMLMTIARTYLGRHARLAATRLWWSFPTTPLEEDLHRASQDRFHFDLDDWQTLKFFFYLTPVDEGAGPHVFVRGSHRRHLWRHQLTPFVGHPADEVIAAYGAANVRTVTGDIGFGFAEDPFGFHMGISPRRVPRLMLEIAFGVSAYYQRRIYG
jgi:hypothetical protein